MTAADLLEAAAQLIERDGWCRRRAKRGTRHCVVGALWEDTVDIGEEYWTVDVALIAEAEARGAYGIAHWNDTICRNGREAAAFIRAAKERL